MSKWFEIIGEQTIAEAKLDRIIHDAHPLTLGGVSLRKGKGTIDKEQGEIA